MPSAPSSALYCLSGAFSGSVRMRTKSGSVSADSSTRIGKRPCSSGMRSLGFAWWKAPAAMNSMWSVRTMPYRVGTFVPSTTGSRSRCTPARETSGPGPAPPAAAAILSISSMKTMPVFSARSSASVTTLSMSSMRSTSSSNRISRASSTVDLRRFFLRGGSASASQSPRLASASSNGRCPSPRAAGPGAR